MQRLSHIAIILFILCPFTASAQLSEKVSLQCNWNDTTGLSNHNGQFYNDVWGFTWKRKEYAAIGSTEGVHIIDVATCEQVAFHKGSTAGQHVIHRDFKTYKNYLYAVCDEGNDARLQIFDLSYLPDSIHEVYRSTSQVCVRAHNIYIDTIKAKLYICGRNNFNFADALNVYSLRDPAQPTYFGAFTNTLVMDYTHDVYVKNDTAYCSGGNQGFTIASFADSTIQDNVLGILPAYDYKGYNHSSWINTKGIGVMADETHGSPLKVIDTREANDIKILSYFMPRPGDSTCIPHNPFILNDSMVLVSYYYDGLQIYNIANPNNPHRAGYFDTYPGPSYKGYAGAWGCYPYLPSRRILVSDMQTGLYVFNADSALGIFPQKEEPKPTPPPEKFGLYPNPVVEKLSVTLPDIGQLAFTITDAAGRTIIKQRIYRLPSQAIELTLPRSCPPGVYTIHVVAGSNTYTGKFVKADN